MEAETNVVSSEDQTEDPGNFAMLANVSTDSTTSPTCGASHSSGGASHSSGGAIPFSGGASCSTGGASPFSGGASHSTGGASRFSGGSSPVGGSSEDGGIAMDMGIKKIPGKSHSIAKKKVTNTGSIRLQRRCKD